MPIPNTFILTDPRYVNHLTGDDHPEAPERHTAINTILIERGLLTHSNTLSPRFATEDEIKLCHGKKYFDKVVSEIMDCDEGLVIQLSTGDVNICSNSFEIAKLAAGGVFTAIDAVMNKIAKNVFCNTRPPGHHACSNQGMGFCIFNNVALGARYAKEQYGVERVLIVDWDVHHGNGTQDIFYNDESVFYFSTHQSDIYPGTGLKSETGKFENICNVPIKKGRNARFSVIDAFQKTLVSKMKDFNPDLVLISAGFDAHKDDPIGGLNLDEADYRTLTNIVCEIADEYCDGRIVSLLEGGYNIKALSESVATHVETLNGN